MCMVTNKMKVLLCLWPGSGGILRHGRWSFLAIALLYGFAFCGLIAVNYYWSELLTGAYRWGTFVLFGLIWLAMTGKSWSLEKHYQELRLPPAPEKDTFPGAQKHYLQGNWFEAECCLNILLQKNPRDIEATLMLATLYRHKNRCDEAAGLLKELELLEDAARWKFEIRSEKRKLIALTSRKKTGPANNTEVRKPEAPEDSEDSKNLAMFDGNCERQIKKIDDDDYKEIKDRRFAA